VSLALITDYDDEYLGILTEDDLVQLPPAPATPPAASLGASCGSCGEQAGSSACASCASGQTTWVLPGPDGAPGDDDK
jgi:hypothetical protein